ncbi:MAG TPA: hypothetical protein VMZ31_09440 [Phycisphaerae bacterium]|nr:hypothetical protein [Phycisphaerae bacterium]
MRNQTTTRSPNAHCNPRRGTILVFVLGVLVMLFLIGTAVIVKTRSERQNVAHLAVAANEAGVMDQAVNAVLEELRRDIWGDDTVALNSDGGDEPWDAPGDDDAWLAATICYLDPNDPGDPNDDFYAWPRVSYGGSNKAVSSLPFDADGDGVRDSVRSKAITVLDPATTGVGVAVRIIDNASMVNVQTAYNAAAYAGYPRRGRWLTDILLDDPRKMLVDPADAGDMTKLFNKDGVFSYATNDPLAYWQVYARTDLLRFPPMYDASEEAALRHRFSLVRYFGQDFPGYAEWFLRRSCLWPATSFPAARDHADWATDTYANSVHWWMFDYNAEDGNNPMHWQNRIAEDPRPDLAASDFVRRLLLTTTSKEVMRRPTVGGGAAAPTFPALYFKTIGPGPSFLADMNTAFVGDEMATLNFYGRTDVEKARSLAQLARCFYYSGLTVGHPQVADPTWMAWQLALNVLDYRDADDVPSVLTKNADGSGPYAFGLERQPFLTEAYADIVMQQVAPAPPPEDWQLQSRRCAVEIFNPWWNDTTNPTNFNENDYQVLVGGRAYALTGVSIDGGPPAPSNGYTVLTDEVPLTITNNPNARQDAGFVINQGDIIELQQKMYDPSGTAYPAWLTIDRIVPDPNQTHPVSGADLQFAEVKTGTSDYSHAASLQRDKEPNPASLSEWRFSVARQKLESWTSGAAAGGLATHLAPDGNDRADLSANVPPCPWIFRNDAAAADLKPSQTNPSFDSVGELSRVLAYGHLTPVAVANVPEAVSSRMLNIDSDTSLSTDEKKQRKMAAGRVNFFYDETDAAKDTKDRTLFRYISTLTAAADDIDNNGDTKTDYLLDPNEAAEAKYLMVHGRLNINTAPRDALYAVPFMFDDKGTGGPGWDLAAAIVADREQRKVNDILGGTVAAGTKGDPFTTVATLARLTGGGIDQFAVDAADLADNGTSPWSPEFVDYTSDPSLTAVNDVRERDVLLARWGNLLTVRSDVFTCYILLVDGAGKPIRRAELLIDRTNCFGNAKAPPTVLYRVDTPYTDTTR